MARASDNASARLTHDSIFRQLMSSAIVSMPDDRFTPGMRFVADPPLPSSRY